MQRAVRHWVFTSFISASLTAAAFLILPESAHSSPMQGSSDHSKHHYVVTRGTDESSMPAPQGGNRNLDEHGFRFFCVPSHFSYNDPVVYPGQESAAHLHLFFGNTDVNAHSTSESIVTSGRSTCDGGITNRSAYWIPALYNEDENVVLPTLINLYYKSWVTDRSQINPVPAGLQILTNDKVKGSTGVVVSTVDEELWKATIRVFDHNGVTIEIRFPDCIAVNEDGSPVLTSPGGSDHVAYSSGRCPSSHPYLIPQLTQIVNWSDVAFASDWYLSSDMMSSAPKGTTAHADYMAGWTDKSAQIMADCVREGYRECGPGLQRHATDQFFSPNGQRVYDFFKIADGVTSTPQAMKGWPHMLPMPVAK